MLKKFALDYKTDTIKRCRVVHADCLEWLARIPRNSLHAIVTDPPYGIEYDLHQIEKLANGNGGIWRLPPAFDGSERKPLPRFASLTAKERDQLTIFFGEWAKAAVHALRPGGHIFLASNVFLSQLVFSALVDGGLDFRGQIVRLVRTFRGGDRPKNAELDFPEVSSLPRACYEPWGIFRKPIPKGMTVSECLLKYGTGGIRRMDIDKPFEDVIRSGRTPEAERTIAPHLAIKPQSFMRRLVHASLPTGKGIIADTFMGSGSTIAAAMALGLSAVGVERHLDFYKLSKEAIPQLALIELSANHGP